LYRLNSKVWSVPACPLSMQEPTSPAPNVTSASDSDGTSTLDVDRYCAFDRPKSYCHAAPIKNHSEKGDHFPFAFSPNSSKWRNASDRVVSFAAAQASTSAIKADGIREVTCGSRPVAGRPRFFFGVTFINFFTNKGVTEKRADPKAKTSPASPRSPLRLGGLRHEDLVEFVREHELSWDWALGAPPARDRPNPRRAFHVVRGGLR